METYTKVRNHGERVNQWVKTSGSVSGLQPYYDTTRSYQSRLDGFKNPAWRKQVAQHQPATTSMTASMYRIHSGFLSGVSFAKNRINPSVVNRYDTWGAVRFSGNLTLPPLPVNYASIARSLFWADAYEKSKDFDGLTVLGELGQTVGMLKRPFRDLLRLLEKREVRLSKRLKKLKHKKAKRGDLNAAVTGSWLEVQYGIKPLIMDLEAAHQALIEFTHANNFKYRGLYAKVDDAGRTVSNISWDIPSGTITEQHTHPWYVKARYKGQLRLEPPYSGPKQTQDYGRLGFGWRHFVPTLWELTPWSFLVDYFANIDDIVESFSVSASDIVWYNATTLQLAVDACDSAWFKPFAQSAQWTYSGSVLVTSSSLRERRYITRYGGRGEHLPRPDILLDLPNVRQFSNIVALALNRSRQRFSFL